jgi:hypothetical protein
MRHTVEQIQNNSRFKLLDKLHYDDIVEFATEYVRKRTRSMRTYIVFIIIFFLLQWLAFLFGIFVRDMNAISLLKQFLYGLIISLTIVIPLHELIHALGYLILGAKKIRFGAVLKHFAFYAVADDFVANRNAFIFLALSPFIIVSLLNLAGFIFVQGYASYTYVSVLFFHATMCAGDFAMLSYFEFHRDKELYTFDNVGEKISYFYYKKPEDSK